jgi:hypothetical protein
MLRRVALALVVLAACVGDDPASPSGAADAGVTDGPSSNPESGTPTTDGGGTDAADAALPCVPSPSGLLSWWTSDDTFADHEAQNPMTTVGGVGPLAFVPGHVGKAFSFTGDAHLERNAPVGLDTLSGLTVEAWVKAEQGADGRIFDRSTAGTADGWLFDVYLGKLRLAFGNTAIESNGQFPLAVTKHVAATFDGTKFRLFIDGVENNVVTVDASLTVPAPNLPLRIGGAFDGTATPRARWKGFIDEAAIYSRGLLPSEIAALYAAGAGGRCKH